MSAMDLQAARSELKSFIEKQKSDFLGNPSFTALEKTICNKVDEVVLEIWRGTPSLATRGFALFAIGGYGRGGLHPESDLDLLLFFHRHPHSLLTSERLAAYVGYDRNQVGRSLDLLTDAGLLTRSQNSTHAARMYVLQTPGTGWLVALLDIASTREGRRSLLDAMKEASDVETPNNQSTPSDALPFMPPRTKAS